MSRTFVRRSARSQIITRHSNESRKHSPLHDCKTYTRGTERAAPSSFLAPKTKYQWARSPSTSSLSTFFSSRALLSFTLSEELKNESTIESREIALTETSSRLLNRSSEPRARRVACPRCDAAVRASCGRKTADEVHRACVGVEGVRGPTPTGQKWCPPLYRRAAERREAIFPLRNRQTAIFRPLRVRF